MTLMSLFRPLTPAELVQWTLRIYARHWSQWILLAILTVVPLVIANQAIAAVAPIPDVSPAVLNEVFGALEQGTMPSEQSMSQVSDFSMASLQQAALSVLAQVVIVGVVAGGAGAVLTSAAYHGQEASLGQALHTGLVERGGLLVRGHLTLSGLLLMLLLASLIGLLFCVGALGLGLTVYLYLAWVPLLAPALTLGDGTYGDLTRRAWRFGKLRVWLLFGATVILVGLRLLLGVPASLIVGLVGNSAAATLVMSMLVEILVLPLGVIFFTLVYEDTRARVEGVSAPDAPAQLDSAAGQPREPFLTAADMPNLIGVSMTALALLAAAYFLVVYLVLFPLVGG